MIRTSHFLPQSAASAMQKQDLMEISQEEESPTLKEKKIFQAEAKVIRSMATGKLIRRGTTSGRRQVI